MPKGLRSQTNKFPYVDSRKIKPVGVLSRVKNPSGLVVAGLGEGDAADKKAKYTK